MNGCAHETQLAKMKAILAVLKFKNWLVDAYNQGSTKVKTSWYMDHIMNNAKHVGWYIDNNNTMFKNEGKLLEGF